MRLPGSGSCVGATVHGTGATVVLNDNRLQGPGCALVEARMLEADLPSKPEVVTALARPPWHRSGQL